MLEIDETKHPYVCVTHGQFQQCDQGRVGRRRDGYTYWEPPVSHANVVTGFAEIGIVSQELKGVVKFGEVLVALCPTPRLFSKSRYSLQIRLGSGS